MTLFDDYSVSLATIRSRVRCDLALPEDPEGYQFEYLTDKDWELTESTLTIRDGKFFLHLGFRQPTTSCGQSTAENGTVLGVDLGVENLAVTSTARFFSGRKLNHERREFEKRRGELQQVGTRSAHRTLKQVAEREKRYVREYLHRTSKQVVDEARQYDCTTIVFEDLSDIRESIPEADWFHIWAFRRLFEYTRYKAKENGIKTVQIDPTHTSQQCPECGHVAKTNRPRRNYFHCEKCGTQANADYNAAKNIGLRFVRRGQQSSRRTGTGQCALKSGTLARDGNFSPYPTNS
jgi:IS605 OrfB family transposase